MALKTVSTLGISGGGGGGTPGGANTQVQFNSSGSFGNVGYTDVYPNYGYALLLLSLIFIFLIQAPTKVLIVRSGNSNPSLNSQADVETPPAVRQV